MTLRRLAAPWVPAGSRAYCVPGSVVLKLGLGEAPEGVPARNDVRDGAAEAASALDGGAVDRIIRQRAGHARIARLHTAAANIGRAGRRHRGYDAAEEVSGLARTFMLQVERGTPLGPLCDALSAVTTVEAASPNWVCMTPFDVPPHAPATREADEDGWATRHMVRAAQALAYEPGDPALIVAVVDSGISEGHPEFTARIRAGYDTVQLGAGDVAPGITLLGDRMTPDHDPTDDFVGHGMGCAGIIGALGIKLPPGLAGEAQILPMRALGAARLPGRDGAIGLGAIADLDAAVKLAVDLGAKVLNLSFGTDDALLPPGAPKPHLDVVAYALERSCVLVAASGNNGAETIYWPAGFPGVIAVGAVALDGGVAPFTTRGAHVALCAPGESILTTGLSGLQRATGTSFAAPFVAGAAALMIARAARRAVPLDGATVDRLLRATARPFTNLAQGCGAGVLDAVAALAAVDALVDRLPAGYGAYEPGIDRGDLA
ncbi:MAG: S8 family serine peptidase [Hyphomicrobiaceae bacterium]